MTNRDVGEPRPTAHARPDCPAAVAFRWVILLGLLAMLGANLPGHLSVDSVIQLYEGRIGVRQTWAPAIMSWLLGRFDDLAPGAGLYVTASGLLLAASLIALRDLRPRTSWAGPVIALLVVLTPTFMVYQAIVWKDVLFANLSVAGFVCLAHAARCWPRLRGRLAGLAGAMVFLALAALARQNGLVVVLVAASVAAWTARGRGLRSSAAWGLGFLAATMLLAQAVGAAVQPPGSKIATDRDIGLRILRHYDIVGAVAHDPGLRLGVIAGVAPRTERLALEVGPRVYSPVRIEDLGREPALMQAFWRLPDDVVASQWRKILVERPMAYLAHRAETFQWVFLTPKIELCLPWHVGIDGPPDLLRKLAIPAETEPQDIRVGDYARRFVHTPLYNHLTYAVLALAVAGVLLLRRDPADIAMAGLMLAGLGFAASFFVISVACDYRYLYMLDLAALTGLVYLALDPPFGARRRPAG